MNLSPNDFPKSEVEANSQYVKEGDELAFYGEGWAEYYDVIAVDETGMTVIDSQGEEFTHTFKSLQVGWEFMDSPKEPVGCASFE